MVVSGSYFFLQNRVMLHFSKSFARYTFHIGVINYLCIQASEIAIPSGK